MTNAVQTTTLSPVVGTKSNLSQIARLLDLVKTAKERFILPDYNAVMMNLEDYEDMLLVSNPRIQKEIEKAVRDYKKTGGMDYMEYRKKRLIKKV